MILLHLYITLLHNLSQKIVNCATIRTILKINLQYPFFGNYREYLHNLISLPKLWCNSYGVAETVVHNPFKRLCLWHSVHCKQSHYNAAVCDNNAFCCACFDKSLNNAFKHFADSACEIGIALTSRGFYRGVTRKPFLEIFIFV